jgi:hypothetical protein
MLKTRLLSNATFPTKRGTAWLKSMPRSTNPRPLTLTLSTVGDNQEKRTSILLGMLRAGALHQSPTRLGRPLTHALSAGLVKTKCSFGSHDFQPIKSVHPGIGAPLTHALSYHPNRNADTFSSHVNMAIGVSAFRHDAYSQERIVAHRRIETTCLPTGR